MNEHEHVVRQKFPLALPPLAPSTEDIRGLSKITEKGQITHQRRSHGLLDNRR